MIRVAGSAIGVLCPPAEEVVVVVAGMQRTVVRVVVSRTRRPFHARADVPLDAEPRSASASTSTSFAVISICGVVESSSCAICSIRSRLSRQVADDQRVRAALDQHAAAARQRRRERRRELAGVRVVELDDPRLERLHLRLLRAGGLALERFRLQLVRRRRPGGCRPLRCNRARRTQHRAQRFLPAHVLQPDVIVALDLVGDDDVPAAELRDRAHTVRMSAPSTSRRNVPAPGALQADSAASPTLRLGRRRATTAASARARPSERGPGGPYRFALD